MLKVPARSWTTETLYEGGDYDRFRQLTSAYNEAVALSDASDEKSTARLGDDSAVVAAAAELDEFTAEAAGRGQVVKVMAPTGRVYRELVAANPAREGNEADARLGADATTFPLVLVPACLPLEGVDERQFESEEARAEWVQDLSPGNFDRLYRAALSVSREAETVDPKVSVSSRLARTSGERSEQPERLG